MERRKVKDRMSQPIHISWEQVGCTDSQAPAQTCWIRVCVLTRWHTHTWEWETHWSRTRPQMSWSGSGTLSLIQTLQSLDDNVAAKWTEGYLCSHGIQRAEYFHQGCGNHAIYIDSSGAHLGFEEISGWPHQGLSVKRIGMASSILTLLLWTTWLTESRPWQLQTGTYSLNAVAGELIQPNSCLKTPQ